MTIKVFVNGAHGKMGRCAVAALNADSRFSVVGGGERGDNFADALQQTDAEVVVDLTSAEVVHENLATIIEAQKHPVIGTSGLSADDIEQFKQQCQRIELGGLVIPNFSIGAVLMMQFAEQAARYLQDVEIIEYHHSQKRDAPSGTARFTAERINAVHRQQTQQRDRQNQALPSTVPGARGALVHDIPVHAVRLPGVVARQDVIFGAEGETLTLSHNSIDRQCFMPGLLLACEKVNTLRGLQCGLEHVLTD